MVHTACRVAWSACFVLPWSSILAKSGLCARRHRHKHVPRVISMSNARLCLTLSFSCRHSARAMYVILRPLCVQCCSCIRIWRWAQSTHSLALPYYIHIRGHKEKSAAAGTLCRRRAHFATHRDFPTRISTFQPFFRAITSMCAAVREDLATVSERASPAQRYVWQFSRHACGSRISQSYSFMMERREHIKIFDMLLGQLEEGSQMWNILVLLYQN